MPSRAFSVYRIDKIMTAETFKRGRSASLWNWLGMRFDHHHQRRGDRRSNDSCKVNLDESNRMKVADVTPVANFHLSCLTLSESPSKRRWNPKRMKRPVSCYVLSSTGMGNEEKNGSYYETHFPCSEPIPQRLRTTGSIQDLVSLDTSTNDQVWWTTIVIAHTSLINQQRCFFGF